MIQHRERKNGTKEKYKQIKRNKKSSNYHKMYTNLNSPSFPDRLPPSHSHPIQVTFHHGWDVFCCFLSRSSCHLTLLMSNCISRPGYFCCVNVSICVSVGRWILWRPNIVAVIFSLVPSASHFNFQEKQAAPKLSLYIATITAPEVAILLFCRFPLPKGEDGFLFGISIIFVYVRSQMTESCADGGGSGGCTLSCWWTFVIVGESLTWITPGGMGGGVVSRCLNY